MDRLEAMSILLKAAQAGSLSQASRDLGLPLATVSRKVADLEAHLGADLLTRSSKGLVPTPAGRSFLTAAKAILEQLNEAERTAAGEYVAPTGELVVAAPVVFGRRHVLPVLSDFLDAFPNVDVGLVLSDRVTRLVDENVDVALRIGDLPDSAMTASRVGTVRRVVCASPVYITRHGRPTKPDDIRRFDAITSGTVSAPSVWRFESGGIETVAIPRSRFSVNTVEAAIDAAVAGMGLARAMSYQIVEHVRQGTLMLVLEDHEPARRPVHLVYDSRSRLPLKLRAFVDFVVPRLRRRVLEAEI